VIGPDCGTARLVIFRSRTSQIYFLWQKILVGSLKGLIIEASSLTVGFLMQRLNPLKFSSIIARTSLADFQANKFLGP